MRDKGASNLGFPILNAICFLCQFVGELFFEDVFDGNGADYLAGSRGFGFIFLRHRH